VKLLNIIREEFLHLLAVFLAFFFMIFVAVYFIGLVKSHLVDNAEGVLDAAEEAIYAKFREAEVTVLSASISLQNYIHNNYSQEEIKAYIEGLAERLIAPSTGITSFLDVYGYINGKFISGNRWIPPAGFVVTERPWYHAAMNDTDNLIYTIPYLDEESGKIIMSAAKVLKDAQGNAVGIVAVDIDINDLSVYAMAFNARLNAAEDGYGVSLINPDFVYIAHPNDNYLGKHFDEVSEKHAQLAEAFLQGIKKQAPVTLTDHDGRKVKTFFRKLNNGWYLGIAAPVDMRYYSSYVMACVLSGIGILFILILNHIIIQMGKARIKADQENRSKTSFLARMSHEIRTPMNAIVSLVEIILRKNISDDVREHMQIIKRSSITLLALINDILDVSKLEAGQLQLEAKPYRISPLINDVANVIRMRIGDKPLEFAIVIEDDVPAELIGDEIRIKQILINLLTNAVKYTKAGRIELNVGVKKQDDDTHLTLFFKVSDTGIGIRQKDIELLFTEFSRIDTKRNQGIEGTGLGLAIVNNLCKAMGGAITVSSVYEQGTTFTVSLSQGFDGGKTVSESQNLEEHADFENKPPFVLPDARVLVVDDIDTNLMVAEELLRFYELRIDTATNGEDALRLIRENFYDLVFMDHMMPEMDGIETTRRIRALGGGDPYFRRLPIVALTANALVEFRELFLKNGFNDFLAKPIEIDKLYAILKKWLPLNKQQESPRMNAADTDALAIRSIDVQAGIDNTGGALPAYARVLRLFYHDAEERLPRIKNAAAEGDAILYTTLVHALKSASRSIGATEFGDFAEAMEAAGRNRDIPIIRRRTGELLNQLRSLLDDIMLFLKRNASETETANALSLSKEQMDALRQALTGMQVAEFDSLITEYKTLPISRATREFLEGIEEDVLLFEYEKAVDKIDKMLLSLIRPLETD
jgi:signal transduction histidine kinase/DNA-binding response OmpR family regulator